MLRTEYCTAVLLFMLMITTIIFKSGESYALGKLCDNQQHFALAVHGGAVWGSNSHAKKEAFLQEQLLTGRQRLINGDKAIDVIETIISEMENSGLFNAGKGSIANNSGEVEMDASIMDGKHLRAGSVASIRKLKNPISAARLVMDNTPHVMMVGVPADRYLAKLGSKEVGKTYFLNSGENYSQTSLPENIEIPIVDPALSNFLSQFPGVWGGVLDGKISHIVVLNELNDSGANAIVAFGSNEDLGIAVPVKKHVKAKFLNGFLIVETDLFRIAYRPIDSGKLEAILSVKNGGRATGILSNRPDLIKKSGTVGAVAMDRCGNLAAGTSTGGFTSKIAGRVGDSPLIGSGTYADNRSVAVSATGHGEYFIRHVVAHEIAARVRHGGQTLIQATYQVIFRELKNNGGEGGVIAIDNKGKVVMLYNTNGMVRGSTTDKFSPKVYTYKSE